MIPIIAVLATIMVVVVVDCVRIRVFAHTEARDGDTV